MKVGVLTFHDADNYGAVLQAYALKEAVKDIDKKYNAEIINYKMPYIINEYKLFATNKENYKQLTRSLISSVVNLRNKIIKKHRFNEFRYKYMEIGKTMYKNAQYIWEYDMCIVGSDQVWNIDLTGGDKVFFLKFCDKSVKKIAYAASIGKEKLGNRDITYIKENIDNLDYISVREISSVKLLRQFTDKKILPVLDPTMLLEEKHWRSFSHSGMQPSIESKGYVLIYMVSYNEEVLKIAEHISKSKGIKVIYLTESFKHNNYGFKKIKNAGPSEFLEFIKNAQFVVTNSFHGTAFSIIFRKNFITVPHETTGSRMRDLLESLSLEQRLVKTLTDTKKEHICDIDYKIPEKLLDANREKSLLFLKAALSGKEEMEEKVIEKYFNNSKCSFI